MRTAFSCFVLIGACLAQDTGIPPIHTSVTITASPVEPAFDRRDSAFTAHQDNPLTLTAGVTLR